MMFKLLLQLLLILSLFLSCSDQAGGSIEVSNGFVSGQLHTEDSTIIAFHEVSFYPVDYNPVSGDTTKIVHCTTSSEGVFVAKVPENKRFNAIARSRDNKAILIPDINVTKNDTNSIGLLYLQPTGSIKISATTLTEKSGSLYLKGTDIVAPVTADTIVITGVPILESYTIAHEKSSKETDVIEEDLIIPDEDTLSLDFTKEVLVLGDPTFGLHKELLSTATELNYKLLSTEFDTLSNTDSTGIDGILILPQSALTTSELGRLNSFTKPILVNDYKTLFLLHMALTEDEWNVGVDTTDSSVIISKDTHPILQGQFSEFETPQIAKAAYNSKAKIGWSEPGAPAVKLAVGMKDQDHQHIFTLNGADKMADDFVIPAKRVAFLIEAGGLTSEGKTLYKRSLQWLLGEL